MGAGLAERFFVNVQEAVLMREFFAN